jgi:hypothetical protein
VPYTIFLALGILRSVQRLTLRSGIAVIWSWRNRPCLQHIAIVRTHVAHLGLLILRQTYIVCLLPLPVLGDAREVVCDAGCGSQTDERDTDAVAFVEEGLCIGGCEAVGGDYTSDVAEYLLASKKHVGRSEVAHPKPICQAVPTARR